MSKNNKNNWYKENQYKNELSIIRFEEYLYSLRHVTDCENMKSAYIYKG